MNPCLPRFIPLMQALCIARRGKVRPRTWPGAAMGDKACSSAANRAYLRNREIKNVIPAKEDQKKHRRVRGRAGAARPPSTGNATRTATRSNAAPRSSGSSAGVATRYNKRELICQGTLDVASIRIWLKTRPMIHALG